MGSNSPSARKHRALKFLGHLVRYKSHGPLIGPKEAHQPQEEIDPQLFLDVARIFPHDEGQQLWWDSYRMRQGAYRQDLVDDLRRRVARDEREIH